MKGTLCELQTSPGVWGLGHRPFTAVTRVRIRWGTGISARRLRAQLLIEQAWWRSWLARRPVWRRSRVQVRQVARVWRVNSRRRVLRRLGSSVGTSARLKIVRSTVRSRPSHFKEAGHTLATSTSLYSVSSNPCLPYFTNQVESREAQRA